MLSTPHQAPFALNRQSEPQIRRIGLEQTPVIQIDDFLMDLEPLRQAAERASFEPDPQTYYPGIRAPLPKAYVVDTVQYLIPLLQRVYGIPRQARMQPRGFCFSLITQAPESLKPLQCLPHFDTPDRFHFAILHYLNAPPHGDTLFFRHRASTFERVGQERMDDYFDQGRDALAEVKANEPGYRTGSDRHYDCYDRVSYRANRLAIYPGNLLHSTAVMAEQDIDPSPSSGRLTANLFISFQV
ncbi:DUF6445 family protein [Ferrimonas marina]|uniref:Uncharacterized protein n=1 Tax=Ferrimonas marina TaxID=299255 RepID=A0A1M5YW52_9GAMM|nr:DUF6445 family protein [Ferrimonas marina]SHI16292.1 hypothetical protein SAMN02745129_4549 [Ferrimonas marina]